MAPSAAPDPARECRQTDRAPAGMTRFKVRSLAADGPLLYILARDEDEARAFYVTSQRLAGPAAAGAPLLTVTQLPD